MPAYFPQGILHQAFKVSSELGLALFLQLLEPAMVSAQTRVLWTQVGSLASSTLQPVPSGKGIPYKELLTPAPSVANVCVPADLYMSSWGWQLT